ncbi:hypothetical protein [Micromonospora sp. 4G55]|uniref:hypothetical protein n=1 Tax=Micromonospora sp. 4G55 TaxID=2806102 RepID=UPI001A6061ED|nr:hypothetical protein [Micromonospora sp. 4G55]MBM0255761.1 hypothetical protein [Micromonospora sp. 4G55]MBM0257904.1 hypothetical protein [Micromonospora sp. 4G55]
MSEPHLDVLHRLLQHQGYALALDELAEACAQQPDEVCALLSQAGIIAATQAQITALTDAANLLCDVHNSAGADTVLTLRERLDRIAGALTTALAQRDKATAALRRTCQALISTDSALVTTCDVTSAAGQPDGATKTTP